MEAGWEQLVHTEHRDLSEQSLVECVAHSAVLVEGFGKLQIVAALLLGHSHSLHTGQVLLAPGNITNQIM